MGAYYPHCSRRNWSIGATLSMVNVAQSENVPNSVSCGSVVPNENGIAI